MKISYISINLHIIELKIFKSIGLKLEAQIFLHNAMEYLYNIQILNKLFDLHINF